MKKTGITITILSAALLFGSASVWEGAVSVSLNGELPKGGFYVATRSFPRNTAVDVTNLENGKTVRVTVAAGMDSPGLLAILSVEAADALGIPVQSTGRVRMTMPSDPEAFSLFTRGANTGEGVSRLTTGPAPASRDRDSPDTPPVRVQDMPESGGYDEDSSSTGEGTPAWDEAPELLIVDIPGTPEPGGKDVPDRTAASIPSPGGEPESEVPSIGVTVQGIPIIERPADEAAPRAMEGPEYLPDGSEDEFTDLPELAEESSVVPTVIPTVIPTEEIAAEDKAEEAVPGPGPAPGETSAFSLVPAEPRPPEASAFTLPPEAEINPIPEAYLTKTPREISPEPPRPPDHIPRSGEAVVSGPGGKETAGSEEPATTGEAFSVPVISRLDKDKYYLHLGAYTRVELAEAALSRIEGFYPLVVQTGGTFEKPLYRILLGPVNLGEGGALLQRFKRSGYRDAFLKQDN
jgi:hypothetical protein